MALQKQVVPIEISTGIDTKTDPKKVQGKLISLINAVFQQSRALLKRFGYVSLPQTILSGSSIGSGVTISPYQNELVELDGKNLYSYSDQQAKWVNKGSLTTCEIGVTSIVKNSRGQTTQDQAIHSSGFQVFTWEDSSGGSYYSVIDTGTGQTIVNSVLLSTTGYMAKPMAVGNFIVIFYYEKSTPALVYRSISMSTPTTIGSAVTVETSLNTFNLPANSICYDASLINTSIYIAVAGTSNIGLYTLSSTLALSARTALTGATTTSTQNLAIFGDLSFNAWVSWFQTIGSVNLHIYSANYATTVLANTTVDSFSAAPDFYEVRNLSGIVIGTTCTLFYESDQLRRFTQGNVDAFYGDYIRTNTVTIAGVVGTPRNVIRSLGIASKPFVYQSTIYMLTVYDAERTSSQVGLVYDPSTESTYFVIDSSGNIIAKVAQLNGGGVTQKFIVPEALLLSTGVYQLSYLFKDRLTSESGTIFTQTGVNAANLSFVNYIPSKLEIGKVLLSGGGTVQAYDGASPTELNFHLYPELMTAQVGAVSGAMAPGSYEYQSMYEWTDNQAQINRSETSDALVVKVAFPQIVVATTNAATTVLVNQTISPTFFFSSDVGWAVSGTGIPANTTIVSYAILSSPTRYQITLSQAATATQAEITLTLSPIYTITGETLDTLPTMTVDPITYFPVSFYQGKDNLLYAGDISNLEIGMTIDGSNKGAGFGTITTIDATTSAVTGGISGVNRARKLFTGTFTSGSTSVTGVSAPIYSLLPNSPILDGITSDGTNFRIATYNSGASTITLSAPFGGSSGSKTGYIYMYASTYLKPGQLVTGTEFPTGTYIKSATPGATNLSNVVMSNPATASNPTASYQITNTFSVSVSVPTIRATNKNNVSLVLYRTPSNLTSLYRTTSVSSPILNNRNVDISFIPDKTSDYNLIGNEQIYTLGGEVDNTSPPASSRVITYKNRAILIPSDNLLSWWFSKQVIPGSPVEFSNLFVQNIDSLGGGITAPAAMDDKLIFFKNDNIFYGVGEGPTPSGTQNDFSEPQLISTDTGCDNPASIVLMPDGLMFQSTKGIYLLARNLEVSYIGADVEAYTTAGSVTSAILIEDFYQVRFTMSTGVCLVYDYFFKVWSVFTNIAAVDACIYQGLYSYLTTAGLVNNETPGTYTDNGAFIQMSLTTSWMSFAGLQGFQRVWRALVLGQYKSPHTLQVNVGVDFASSFEQNVVIPVTTNPGNYQYRIHMKTQKCEAIQFQIQDSQTSSFGEGLSLAELSLEVGIKQGANKMSAGKSF